MTRLFNLARMTSSTTGAGTIALAAAATGHLSFADAGVPDGVRVFYGIEDGNASEVGRGIYTAAGTTLSRGPITSTNSNNAINLSGNAQIFITALGESFDETGSFTAADLGAVTTAQTITEDSVYELEYTLGADVTFSFDLGGSATRGFTKLIRVVQDGTGGRTPTFQTSGAVALTALNVFPTWTSRPANAWDLVTVLYEPAGGNLSGSHITGST